MAETNRNDRSAPRREPRQSGEREASQTKKRKKRRRPLILTVLIRILQVIGTLILIGVVTGSFMICYAAVYVKTVVMPKTYMDLSEYTLNENSIIYYQDKDTGQWKELQTLVGDVNRELVRYTDIPQDLINAYIAIEDKRFWKHNGVDWKRTAAGLLRMFTGQSIQGGSTIDQQLIKNLTTYDDVTVTRKIQEIFTALELENNYSKEMILTVYLNYIYMGNGCSGVQAASRYYFGKDVWDLNLAECASLAGITNNPSLYAPYGVVEVVRYKCQTPGCKDPYSNVKEEVCGSCGSVNSFDDGTIWTNREFNKDRQETILKEMAKEDEARDNKAYITETERDAAIAAPLVFARDVKPNGSNPDDPDAPDTNEDSKTSVRYSWYVEAVIDDAIEALMEARGINEDAAGQLVFNGGLSIYTTYDPTVQAAVDTVFNDRSNLDQVSASTGQRLMASITVVDNSRGYVVAIGNTMEKTVDRGLNPAVDTVRQPGSSIKPLSVYSPALEMGLITPASVVDDNPLLVNGQAWPINVYPIWGGLTTVMDGVTRSLNTVAVRVLDMVTPQESYNFMVEKYGITTLEQGRTINGEWKTDIDRSPLATGGLTYGLTTFEAAAAFATFPRNGAFTPPTTILEIKDASERTIIDNSNTTQYVIKASTAYYITSMLSNAVTSATGTANAARLSGQVSAGKTGTTNRVYNLWFCGYTPYYTAAVWTGYRYDEQINNNLYNPSVTLWQKVMDIVHQELESREFDVPGELSTYQVCMDCGKQATGDCANDIRGSRIQSFRLLSGDGPREACTCHVSIEVCIDSPIMKDDDTPTGYYHRAGEFCPEESIRTVTLVDYERELATPYVSVGDQMALLSSYEDVGTCDVHTEEPPDESGEPTESVEPGESDPPDESDPPYVDPGTEPPTSEPTLPPEEPTETVEPDDDPYVPVDGPDL